MWKLGATSSLAVSLAFAAFHSTIPSLHPVAVDGVRNALQWLDRLTQLGVQLDPRNQIRPRRARHG